MSFGNRNDGYATVPIAVFTNTFDHIRSAGL